ncbi:MAG: DNA/RNA nuclease SfsA [Pseudomonadota bacterium]
MRFPTPLERARLVKRYKRFLSDHELESGDVVTAHCANPGGMIGLKEPGMETWLSPANNPKRKLQWDWQLAHADGGLVGINTSHPNGLVAEAIEAGAIPELTGYESLRREVKYGANSRIDILLEQADRPPCYVEIKNCHLKRDKLAEFPDAVTARGAKHMGELANMVEAGNRAAVFYVIQRMDCPGFAVADDIDPTYAAALRDAMARGVEAYAYSCRLTPDEIVLDKAVPLHL